MLRLTYNIHSFLFVLLVLAVVLRQTHMKSQASLELCVVQTGLKLITVFLPQPFGCHHIQLKVTFERLVVKMTGIHPIDNLKWILGLGGPQRGESHLFLKVLWAEGAGWL